MNPSFTFKNGTMKLTVLCYEESGRRNLALLIRHGDGMFIIARNVSQDTNSDYSWDWGHYFTDLHDALADYDERRTMF